MNGCSSQRFHHRGFVLFLRAEGVKQVEMQRLMLAQSRAPRMNQRKLYEWVERFNAGKM